MVTLEQYQQCVSLEQALKERVKVTVPSQEEQFSLLAQVRGVDDAFETLGIRGRTKKGIDLLVSLEPTFGRQFVQEEIGKITKRLEDALLGERALTRVSYVLSYVNSDDHQCSSSDITYELLRNPELLQEASFSFSVRSQPSSEPLHEALRRTYTFFPEQALALVEQLASQISLNKHASVEHPGIIKAGYDVGVITRLVNISHQLRQYEQLLQGEGHTDVQIPHSSVEQIFEQLDTVQSPYERILKYVQGYLPLHATFDQGDSNSNPPPGQVFTSEDIAQAVEEVKAKRHYQELHKLSERVDDVDHVEAVLASIQTPSELCYLQSAIGTTQGTISNLEHFFLSLVPIYVIAESQHYGGSLALLESTRQEAIRYATQVFEKQETYYGAYHKRAAERRAPQKGIFGMFKRT